MLKAIAQVQTSDRNQNQLQSNIITQLTVLIKNPLMSGQILEDVQLLTGSNTIDHKLNRDLIGWFLVRQRSAGNVFDTQDSNDTPNLNLLLTSSADILVDIYVF